MNYVCRVQMFWDELEVSKSCHPVEARPCQCGLLVGDLSTLYFATNFLPLEIRIVDPENWINAKCKSP